MHRLVEFALGGMILAQHNKGVDGRRRTFDDALKQFGSWFQLVVLKVADRQLGIAQPLQIGPIFIDQGGDVLEILQIAPVRGNFRGKQGRDARGSFGILQHAVDQAVVGASIVEHGVRLSWYPRGAPAWFPAG